jgi:hypothetical protein
MRWALLILLASMSVAAAAYKLDPARAYFEDTVQDGHGLIWAGARGVEGELYPFDGTTWSTVTPPLPDRSFSLVNLARLSDGSVACLWRSGDGKTLALTRHSAGQGELIGTCPGDAPQLGLPSAMLADSQGGLWITGNSRKIYHAGGKGGFNVVHEISDDELLDFAALKMAMVASGPGPIPRRTTMSGAKAEVRSSIRRRLGAARPNRPTRLSRITRAPSG